MNRCETCQYNNISTANYCEKCGSVIKKKKKLQEQFKRLNFDTLAGTGQKGISIAPLLSTSIVGKKVEEEERKSPVPIIQINSTYFYCTYCGAKNKAYSLSCMDCGRYFSYISPEAVAREL